MSDEVESKPTRGRKGRQSSGLNVSANQQIAAHEKDEFADIRPVRGSERVKLGAGRNLDGVEQFLAPDHVGYWETRIGVRARAQQGWEIVRDDMGATILRRSKAGAEHDLVLMQIPRSIYDQDRAEMHKRARQMIESGAIIDESKGEYTPNRSGYSVARDHNASDVDILG